MPSIATPPPLALEPTRALWFALLVIASSFMIGLAIYDAYGPHHHHHHHPSLHMRRI